MGQKTATLQIIKAMFQVKTVKFGQVSRCWSRQLQVETASSSQTAQKLPESKFDKPFSRLQKNIKCLQTESAFLTWPVSTCGFGVFKHVEKAHAYKAMIEF